MSHAAVALSKDYVNATRQVSALTAFLVKNGYRVTLMNHPEWLELPEFKAAMREAETGQLYILTLVNAKEEHYCSSEIWMTDGRKTPDSPPNERLEVFLHLGYKEITASIDVILASSHTGNSRHIRAHIKGIVEDALGLGGKIPWKKEDC